MSKNTYYITTPIYYPSGKPHIGTAYTTISSDVMSRYQKKLGKEVFFLTGLDEHGQKIQELAKSKKITPQEHVDAMALEYQKMWRKLDIDYSKFIRTTDSSHKKSVQKIYEKLYNKGDIYKGKYEGYYCTSCEAFYPESQLNEDTTKCPYNHDVKIVKEESYFFKMSKYVDRLKEYYNSSEDVVVPSDRINEMLENFINPGLEDLAISRSTFNWGIEVPNDPKHVLYVWIDALSNYITALGYESDDDSLFKKFWPANVHMLGKDIVRFHIIYWPIILMALDIELPKKFVSHGFILTEGEKMSKSLGNVIDPDMIIDRYGSDALRFYLLKELSFLSDGSFSKKGFVERYNAHLANDLGNLVSRTVSMSNKYFPGKEIVDTKVKHTADDYISMELEKALSTYNKEMENFQYSRALDAAFAYVSSINKYVDLTEPWILGKKETKEDEVMLEHVLYTLLESIRISLIMLEPVLVKTSKIIQQQINAPVNDFSEAKYGIVEGYKNLNYEVLFPRLDVEEEINYMDEYMKKDAPKKDINEDIDTLVDIEFDDFSKLDMRVGKIIEAKKHPKADKLLIFQVDFKNHTRQIVSGIADSYEPKDLIGESVVALINLKPINIRGEKSEGMILTSEKEDKISLIKPSDEKTDYTNAKIK